MDIGKSLQYTFEDERWLSKLGLGALISLVPILNLAWVGYYIDIMKNVMDDKAFPLPEWDEFAEKFMKGLLISVAGFLYALPGLLFLCLPLGLMFIPAFVQDSDAQSTLAVVTSLAGVAMFCCIGFYFLLFSFFFPAVQIHFARQGTFQSCFQLREIFYVISGHASDYLVAWLISLVAGLIVGIVIGVVGVVLGWIPCLGQLLIWAASAIAGAWTGAVYAHIFGQCGRKAFLSTNAITEVIG